MRSEHFHFEIYFVYSSALDKKNCIIDELNKVLVTSEREAATLPTSSSGLEPHCPLIFIDSSELDSTENLTELDEFLPLVGDSYFLPKEQSDDYIDLPIINELGTVLQIVCVFKVYSK